MYVTWLKEYWEEKKGVTLKDNMSKRTLRREKSGYYKKTP